ncbi:hypothetical protein J6590_018814 [Homalodisca vitripennis]|nr:hypothetical protein J6590_018814 [Homalodisca vitripennis]
MSVTACPVTQEINKSLTVEKYILNTVCKSGAKLMTYESLFTLGHYRCQVLMSLPCPV